ncbi:MAG: FHA domain-containing protein [Actinomycetes bacterium]
MSDAALTLLKFAFLALLFVFLSRVVLVVVREMRASRPLAARPDEGRRRGGSTRRDRPWTAVVVAPPEAAGREFVLAPENTIGRAAGCTIALDDTFVSSIHARVFIADGIPYAEDSGSTNGTRVNDAPITGTQRLARGDRIGVGDTVLEVRR